jgi:hypothetical protein
MFDTEPIELTNPTDASTFIEQMKPYVDIGISEVRVMPM